MNTVPMPGTRCVNLPMRGSPGRSGASLPTREVLNFGLAHARARDAIHQPFASQQLVAPLAGARPRGPDGAQRRAGPVIPICGARISGGSSPMRVAPTSPPAASAPPTCCW